MSQDQITAALQGRCPACGSDEVDANRWESWCLACDQQWTKESDPAIYEAIRAFTDAAHQSVSLEAAAAAAATWDGVR